MLPDYKHRNELRFLVAGIPYNVRLLVVLGLWASGLLVQAVLPSPLPGGLIILLGTVLALTRGYSNEPPRAPHGEKRWESVTIEKFARIIALDKEGLRWDRSALIDATNVSGFLTGLLLATIVAFVTVALWGVSPRLASVCAVDSVALLAPFWLTGIRRLYHRTELMIRVRCLQNILDRVSGPGAGGMTAVPVLQLQKSQGGDIP
ncbi:hypothetical protein FJY63_08765 [Candidatus Sumerlaeota bacterium]|nr:hypothetical protein [Candidatus Sumerlaeota bacterium]